MGTYYKNFNSIKSIEDLKEIFPDGQANELNWCLFSTSGVHGTYMTMDDIEQENEEASPYLTVLVIRPRIVSMLYGHIKVDKEDFPYLRELASSSVEQIKISQSGNWRKK